jgi:hypothetical protein
MSCKSFNTIAIAALLFAVGACNGTQKSAPELLTQTPERPMNQPTTVSGCLRSGFADDTFVLHSRNTGGASTDTVTYQLTTGPGVDLHRFAGQEVEVSGTVESEQRVATSGKVQEPPAKGAAGTPVVETKAELDVRKLKVSAVKPSGNRCSD